MAIPVMAHPVDSLEDKSSQSSGNTDVKNLDKEQEFKARFEAELLAIIENKDIKETEQFLVSFTRYVSSDIVSKKLYNVSGCTKEESISVILSRYNEDKGIYEQFLNIEGENRWDIGISGFFTKSFELKKGKNKFKIIIYKKPVFDSLKEKENLAGINGEVSISDTQGTISVGATEDKNNIDVLKDLSSQNDEIFLEEGKNLQIQYFTVVFLDESDKDKLLNSVTKIEDVFKSNIVDTDINGKRFQFK